MDNPYDCESVNNAVKEALQNNDQALAVAKIQDYLDEQNNIPLNIAITGESGSGKSSFVNAFRGLSNRDDEAAPTGCTETTMEVTSYTHPNYPNLTLWDLPGVGTPNFPADKYLKLVGFEKFDFFIIISSCRFKENDVKLAQEIQKMGKKFYFVRSKIDSDLQNERISQKAFNEEETLTKIRENCIKELRCLHVDSPQVFLVSSFDLKLYDFSLLHETLERQLPSHKKNTLLLAMPNISLKIISRKKEVLQATIKYYASASAVGGAVPIPGVSASVDLGLLVGALTQYISGFGLDDESLQRLADSSQVPLKDLIDVTTSPLIASKITHNLVMKLLLQCAKMATLMAAEEGSRFIPVIGIPVAMALSYTTTQSVLTGFLDMLAENAQSIFTKALSAQQKTVN